MLFGQEITSYGCVQFDVAQNAKGQYHAVLGPGWASVDGQPAFRITGFSDLDLDIMWLTNLDQDTYWQAGLFNTPQIKEAKYLRIDFQQIVRELGVSPKMVSPAHSTEAVAEIFGRIMRLAKERFPNLGYGKSSLIQEISFAINLQDAGYEDSIVDEAFSCSFQDRVLCDSRYTPESGERWITFRRPRLFHAQQLIGEKLIIPKGPWTFIGERDMPPKESRMNWLLETFKGQPYMVKVKNLNFYSSLNTPTFNPANLLKLGESILAARQKRPRQWLPMPEFLYVSKFADVEFDSVCVGTEYENLEEPLLPDLDYVMHHSYAWGVLAENIWMTYASRSINPKAKSKTLVSARATWLRTIDRFYCFAAARAMSIPLVNVLSYGTGSVTVSCSEPNMGFVIDHAVKSGLQAPASSYMHWRSWRNKELAAGQQVGSSTGELKDLISSQMSGNKEDKETKTKQFPTPKPEVNRGSE